MAESNEQSVLLKYASGGLALAGVITMVSFPFLEGVSSSGIGTYAFSSMMLFIASALCFFKSVK